MSREQVRSTARRPIVLDDSVEMTISYSRHGSPVSGAIELLKDFALPMAAAGLSHEKNGRAQDIRAVPLISTTTDDWDWRVWAAENNMEFAQLRVACRFDTDCQPLPRAEPVSVLRLYLPTQGASRSRAAC